MPECNHDCSSCGVDCSERSQAPQKEMPHKGSQIKKVIAVVSGKGGVGKSLTTSLLAINAKREGKKVAIIDADVTGPSIPTIFGLHDMATGDQDGTIFPVETLTGIQAMSLNLLMDDPAEPVVWRGPVIAGLIRQFWTDVEYGEIDELYIDMPPGTGDVPLTVFQSIPVDGIVIVTSPQDLVSLIVEKALRMASMMNVPVIGLVRNMAYMNCPHCDEKIYPFGNADKDIASQYGIHVVDELPINPEFAELCDAGKLELHKGEFLQNISKAISEC